VILARTGDPSWHVSADRPLRSSTGLAVDRCLAGPGMGSVPNVMMTRPAALNLLSLLLT